MRHPGIHAEATLPAHAPQVGEVENLEHQPEAILQLSLPLLQHRRRGRDDDRLRLPAQQQLASDEPRLDGLAKPGVVRDEQIHPRQRLAERLHLVGVDADPGAEGRLEEIGVGRRDAVPAQRVQERGEPARLVEAALGEVRPTFFFENPAVDLVVPVDPQRLPLRVVIRAGQRHERGRPRHLGRRDLLHQPAAGAHLDQFTDLGRPFGERADRMELSHWERGESSAATAAAILEEGAGAHAGTRFAGLLSGVMHGVTVAASRSSTRGFWPSTSGGTPAASQRPSCQGFGAYCRTWTLRYSRKT